MSDKNIAIGILGGTGYGAGELLRLLTGHPAAEVVSVVSSSSGGESIASAHPQLEGFYQLPFDTELNVELLANAENSVLFSALPHGTSANTLSEIARANPSLKIVDLSGDFRLKDEQLHAEFYPESRFEAELRAQFQYGLTERYREEIASAKYIANPGCLSATAALAVLPLVDSNFSGAIAFDAKTGTSGAGRKVQESMHHPTRQGNFSAYKILEHRHEPEIRQTLGDAPGERLSTSFVPHLLPSVRGIFVSAYFELAEEKSSEELTELYRKFYASSPFIRVREGSPELRNVVGSNFCDVSITARGRQVVAMAALDNLVKGMAGQAIQNMNLICGLPETTGIWQPALGII